MINKLVAYLEQCDDAYYNSSNPLVSDDTYDAMVESLRRLDPENPYLNKVGAKLREGSVKLGRTIPMGTLRKYHTDDEVRNWLSTENEGVMLCPKYDGFGVELIYKDCNLVMASTRGTGYVGEDVLSSIMRISNVPAMLPSEFHSLKRVRGEAIIPRKYHEQIKNLGYTAMRNAVPGIVRAKKDEALSYVRFIAYEFFDDIDNRVAQRVKYSSIFDVEEFTLFQSINFDDISRVRDMYGEKKNSYEYEIDGTVLKTVRIKEDDLLNPTHQVAWKFKSNRRETILRDIEFQMGLTGYFTPIGIFDEVEFQGAKLTRASLGNMTRLYKEFDGMTVGSTIEVSRRGDIIPYIETLISVDNKGKEIPHLSECPHCGSILVYDELEPHCINKSCPEKLRLQVSQYAKSIGIKGIGDKLVRGLIDSGYLRNIVDIYRINPEVILSLPRQGVSSVEKWRQLQQKKLSTLELLTYYPFLNLGRKVWELVLSKFTFMEIMDITEEMLSSSNLSGLGDIKIKSIVDQVSENREELLTLYSIHKEV